MSAIDQQGWRRPNRLAWIASVLLLAVGAGLWAQPAEDELNWQHDTWMTIVQPYVIVRMEAFLTWRRS